MPPRYRKWSSWRGFISSLDPECSFREAPSEGAIAGVARRLGIARFPCQLDDLLSEFDGVGDRQGRDLIMPAAEIERWNLWFRTNDDVRGCCMPFDNLLFFADDIVGNWFGYGITAEGEFIEDGVFCWEHHTDGRPWFAGHLEHYFEKRLSR